MAKQIMDRKISAQILKLTKLEIIKKIVIGSF